MALLEVNGIGKSFGATKVLRDISFDLAEGEALAIIGSSGSGKTTLLRALMPSLCPDAPMLLRYRPGQMGRDARYSRRGSGGHRPV